MDYQVAKDKIKRRQAHQAEVRRLVLRYQLRDGRLSRGRRWRRGLALARLPRAGSRVRVVNRCLATGRAKAVHRPFKLSRLALRELAAMGGIPGLRKASW
jgi:small subunit ribosomal protein S14